MHTVRCSPCAGHQLLERHVGLLREDYSVITNSILSYLQCLQASLRIREGGLRIRRASSLALSAFLASAASTSGLQDIILSACMAGMALTTRFAQHAAPGRPLMAFHVRPMNALSASAPGMHLASYMSGIQFGRVP